VTFLADGGHRMLLAPTDTATLGVGVLLTLAGAVVALLGAIESLLSAVVADGMIGAWQRVQGKWWR